MPSQELDKLDPQAGEEEQAGCARVVLNAKSAEKIRSDCGQRLRNDGTGRRKKTPVWATPWRWLERRSPTKPTAPLK